jgi:hypothetical protein
LTVFSYESQGAQWDGSGGLVEQGEWDISVNIPGISVSLVDGTPKVFILYPPQKEKRKKEKEKKRKLCLYFIL